MEIRDLRYFCLTAELEHVSRAAEKLGVSQPFLTKIIGQLENEVGTSMFDNVGRRIALNQFGAVFYERSKKILAEIDEMMAEMDEMLDKNERSISFVSDTAGYTSHLMLDYKGKHPNNMLSINYKLRDGIITALNTGEANFALCTPPITGIESKTIETEIVFDEPGCVMLPPNHALLAKDVISLNDLTGEPLVTSPRGAGVRNNLEIAFEKCNYVPNVVCESIDMDLIIKAVLGGLGFAILPSWILTSPQYAANCRKLNMPGISAKIGLSCNKNFGSTSTAKEFKEYIREFFKCYAL